MKRQAKPVLSLYPILIGKGLGPDQGLILLALDLGRPDLALGLHSYQLPALGHAI